MGSPQGALHRLRGWHTWSGVYYAEGLPYVVAWQAALWGRRRALKRGLSALHRGVCAARTLRHLHRRFFLRAKLGPPRRHVHRLHSAVRLGQGRPGFERVLAHDLRPAHRDVHVDSVRARRDDPIRQSQVPHAQRPAQPRPKVHPQSLPDRG